MVDTQNPNLEILMLAVDQLGDLSDMMVFLGGCATGLLISDPASPPIRVTKDVDAIDPAMEKLNTVFQAASQDMYQQGGAADAGQGPAAESSQGGGDEEVTDVDFEEVNEEESK